MGSMINPDSHHKLGFKPPEKVKRRTSRQKRERQTRDEQYLAMRDIYLEENPRCACCINPAAELHHIVRGIAGRSRSLLNSDTWLGLCVTCHTNIESLSLGKQIQLKKQMIDDAIERLRK